MDRKGLRDMLAARERGLLAPWALASADAGGREHPEPPPDNRGEFQRDRDRVVHCSAFRRLEYKTQVFPNHEGDHYRTRLTHTVEVTNLSRTLARCLRLNEDFCECLAVVHDLGHPPFGHCGERILAALMEPHGGFEHNEQSHRQVTILERRYPAFPGLNLTRAVLEAVRQHGRGARPGSRPPLLETRLVSLADEIVYDTHDLEDGLSSGILLERDLEGLALWRRAAAGPPGDPEVARRFRVRGIFDLLVTDFLDRSLARLEDAPWTSAEEARQAPEDALSFSAGVAAMKEELERLLAEKMYRHPKVVKMMNKSRYFMSALFEHFRRQKEELPLPFRDRFAAEGVERCVADYIAGMTDRFLQEEWIRLFLPFQKML